MSRHNETMRRLDYLAVLKTSSMTLEEIGSAIGFNGQRDTLRKFLNRCGISFRHETRGAKPDQKLRSYLEALSPEESVHKTLTQLYLESGEPCSYSYFYQMLNDSKKPFKRSYR